MIRARILVHRIESNTYTKKDGSGTGTNYNAICTLYDDGEETPISLGIFGKNVEKVEAGNTYDAGIRLRGREWQGKIYPDLTIIFLDKIQSMIAKGNSDIVENEEYASAPVATNQSSNAPAPNPFTPDDKDDLPF